MQDIHEKFCCMPVKIHVKVRQKDPKKRQKDAFRKVVSQKSFFEISAIAQRIFGQNFCHFVYCRWALHECTSERANELISKNITSA